MGEWRRSFIDGIREREKEEEEAARDIEVPLDVIQEMELYDGTSSPSVKREQQRSKSNEVTS